MIIVKDDNYNEIVMKNDSPFVLVFISKTCIHCKTVEKFLEKVSPNYPNIKIYFIQSEQSFKLLDLFKVNSFPTTHFFKEDKSGVKRIVGATSIDDFISGFESINKNKKKNKVFGNLFKKD